MIEIMPGDFFKDRNLNHSLPLKSNAIKTEGIIKLKTDDMNCNIFIVLIFSISVGFSVDMSLKILGSNCADTAEFKNCPAIKQTRITKAITAVC
jgi:hypothetical protein